VSVHINDVRANGYISSQRGRKLTDGAIGHDRARKKRR
jgi:hypothetical protein